MLRLPVALGCPSCVDVALRELRINDEGQSNPTLLLAALRTFVCGGCLGTLVCIVLTGAVLAVVCELNYVRRT